MTPAAARRKQQGTFFEVSLLIDIMRAVATNECTPARSFRFALNFLSSSIVSWRFSLDATVSGFYDAGIHARRPQDPSEAMRRAWHSGIRITTTDRRSAATPANATHRNPRVRKGLVDGDARCVVGIQHAPDEILGLISRRVPLWAAAPGWRRGMRWGMKWCMRAGEQDARQTLNSGEETGLGRRKGREMKRPSSLVAPPRLRRCQSPPTRTSETPNCHPRSACRALSGCHPRTAGSRPAECTRSPLRPRRPPQDRTPSRVPCQARPAL